MQAGWLHWSHWQLIQWRNVLSDKELRRLFRNANIGLAIGVAVLLLGFYPARHSEVALTALGLAMFAISMGVFIGLSARDEKARHKSSSRPS